MPSSDRARLAIKRQKLEIEHVHALSKVSLIVGTTFLLALTILMKGVSTP